MAEINIGTLSGGGGGGGGGTWLKPEMEGGNDVNITSNQVLTFLHIGDPDEFLRIDMSDTDATLRISDTNQNESDLTPFALTFDWRGDTVYPATAQLNPAELLGITGEGIHPALIRIIALHEDFTVSPIIDLGKGVWTGSFLSSGPITPREVIGQLRFWGQNLTGFVTPGALNNLAQGARIEVVAVDSFTETNAAANMLFYTTPTNSITPQLQMELGSDGELELKNYGTGNFEDNNPEYFIGVDLDGNLIEVSPGSVGTGDVVGPDESTDNAIVRWDGITGKIIQDSGVIVDDANNVTTEASFISDNQSGYTTELNSTGVVITDEFSNTNTQTAESIVIDSPDNESTSTLNYNSLHIDNPGDDKTANFDFNGVFLTDQGGVEDLTISVTSIDAANLLTAILGGYNFSVSESKAGKDGYVLTYDEGANVINLQPGGGGGSVNVYNTSANLTGNRQISGDGFSLNIFNTSTFQIEDVTNVMNLEVTPTDVSFFDGAFNYSSANVLETDAVEIDAPNAGVVDLGGRLIFSTTGPVRLSGALGSGFNVLRLMDTFTPSGTADANGAVGALAWDDDYIYMKTSVGWKRATLSTF